MESPCECSIEPPGSIGLGVSMELVQYSGSMLRNRSESFVAAMFV